MPHPLVPPGCLGLLPSSRFNLVILPLQVQPEVRGPLERFLECQGGRRRDRPFAVADFADGLRREAGAPSEVSLRPPVEVEILLHRLTRVWNGRWFKTGIAI